MLHLVVLASARNRSCNTTLEKVKRLTSHDQSWITNGNLDLQKVLLMSHRPDWPFLPSLLGKKRMQIALGSWRYESSDSFSFLFFSFLFFSFLFFSFLKIGLGLPSTE